MISLRKSAEQIERSEKQFQAALGCYLSALSSVEKTLVPGCNDAVYAARQAIKDLRRKAFVDSSCETLESTAAELETELRGYQEKTTAWVEQRERDVKTIMGMLAQAAQSITRHSTSYGSRFGEFASSLEAVCHLTDLGEIRHSITKEVGHLRASLEEMTRESEISVQQLRRELDLFRTRLEQAEAVAKTDHLTGVANRREGERQIEARIKAGRSFCLMLFDVDKFKSLNDRYGHESGDQVLRMFARRLMDCLRPGDLACRWGGDEFLALLDCGLKEAMARATQISHKLAGIYIVRTESKEARVPVSASVGVADYKPGETAAQVFERADALLYRAKAARNG